MATEVTSLPTRSSDPDTQNTAVATAGHVAFGSEMRKQFVFGDNQRNMNHGSFGAHPRAVREAQRRIQEDADQFPDKAIVYTQPKLLNESRAAVATLLNAPTDTVVFIPNATTGINTILRNLVYKPKEKILYFSCLYHSCQKAVLSICETTDAEPTKVNFAYPVADNAILELFRKTVQDERAAGNEIHVAVFDTIVSVPGVRFPYEAMIIACKELGILSCVDGAHGIGQIALDVQKLDPDFFVTNLHKWLYVPRGCAVLYVPDRNQDLIRTSFPTSYGFIPKNVEHLSAWPSRYGGTNFTELFKFVGTLDISPYLCVPAALAFRRDVCGGEDAIMTYMSTVTQQGGKVVAAILGTEVLDNEDETMTKGIAMVNVRLPIDPAIATKSGKENPYIVIRQLWRRLVEDSNTSVTSFWHAGAWWARISGQTYLDEEDFEWLGKTLKKLCEEVSKSEQFDESEWFQA